jgi:hypothetical protein
MKWVLAVRKDTLLITRSPDEKLMADNQPERASRISRQFLRNNGYKDSQRSNRKHIKVVGTRSNVQKLDGLI